MYLVAGVVNLSTGGNFAPIFGFLGVALTALAAVVGVYVRAHSDRDDSREGRYTDNLWRTIDLLKNQADAQNQKITNLEAQREADRAAVDTLRSQIWEARQKLFETQGEASKLSILLEQKQAELDYSQKVLQRTTSELESAHRELDILKRHLAKLEQHRDGNTVTETDVTTIIKTESKPTTSGPAPGDLLS